MRLMTMKADEDSARISTISGWSMVRRADKENAGKKGNLRKVS
jgi:hypothetical protein